MKLSYWYSKVRYQCYKTKLDRITNKEEEEQQQKQQQYQSIIEI